MGTLFSASIILIKLNVLQNAQLDFGLICKNARAAIKIVRVVGVLQNINVWLAILISHLMNSNAFGDALQENIVLPLDFVNGVSLDAIDAMVQLFKTVSLALQLNIYQIINALMIHAQELHT